ncbi:hypothetical protein KKG31_09000, partial [Patescibacteria group bacterium]|nr:hypothetical protein [Patescibacteria group bacterium]
DYSAVYYVAEDGTRWVFPNERTYFTWYDDFDDVVEISCEELADYSIGEVVTYQPGTRLVKIQSINKVYAVEPGGNLRWIQTEDDAETLFGSNWANRIDDVPDGFWPSYTEGDDLPADTFPAGTLLMSTGTGFYYYVESLRQVGQELLTDVQLDYALDRTEDFIQTYASGSISSSDWEDTKALDRAVDQNADELDFSGYSQQPAATDPPDATTLADPGDEAFSGITYSITWDSVADATSYELEEDANNSFSSPSTIYTGTATTNNIQKYVSSVSTYYYRVKATNDAGDSDWSNIESITVYPYQFIADVPDASQPPPNTLGATNVTNWSAPVAAANVLEYIEDEGYSYSSGVTAGNDETTVSDYLGWFMDTNNGGSSWRANSGMSGTSHWDIMPGIGDYVVWGGNNPSAFGFPVPAALGGKTGYNGWTLETYDSFADTDSDAWDAIIDSLDNDEPVVTTFDYWNPLPTGSTIDDIEFFAFGPFIPISLDAMVGGDIPIEEWQTGDVGHSVTAVGYVLDYDIGDGNGAQDWIIVHDNWTGTSENVAVPFENWAASVHVSPGPDTVPGTTTLTGPTAVMTGDMLPLSWDPIYGASSYEIQYDADDTYNITPFTSVIDASDGVFEKPYFIMTPLGSYHYYHIRGVNDVGEGDWSNDHEVDILDVN